MIMMMMELSDRIIIKYDKKKQLCTIGDKTLAFVSWEDGEGDLETSPR